MRHPAHWSKDDGATAVEFALVFPVFAAIVLMTIYGGLYLFYAAVAEHVARSAVRDLTLPVAGSSVWPSTYPDPTTFGTTVDQMSGGLLPSPSSVTINPTGTTANEGDPVTVTVTYNLPAVAAVAKALWFIPSPPTTITRMATARRE